MTKNPFKRIKVRVDDIKIREAMIKDAKELAFELQMVTSSLQNYADLLHVEVTSVSKLNLKVKSDDDD